MARKKWKKPCKCNGKNKLRCMICGWKDEPKRISEMTNMELAALNGKRERVLFLHHLDRQSTKAGNVATGDEKIDALIVKHRAWAIDIYNRVKIKREDPKEIAKELQLTEGIVRRVAQMVSDKIYRGEMVLQPKPLAEANPPPIPPPPPWYYTKSIFQVPTFSKMEEMPEPPGKEEW